VLIEQLGTDLLRKGQVSTLLGWLKALPVDIVQNRPALCFAMAWALLLTGQLDEAERYLACAAKLTEHTAPARGDLLVAQAYLARARGAHEEAIVYAQEALQVLPATDGMARGMVALSLGLAQIARGQLVEAEQVLNEAYTAAQAMQNHYGALTALGLLSAMQLAYGRLHRAAVMCRQVLSAGGQLPPTGMAHSVMGALSYEWNDLAAAANHLVRGTELCEVSGNVDVMIDCLVTLARVRLAQHDHAAARAILTEAQDLVEHKGVAPMAPGKVAAGWTALALAEGDLTTARFWAPRTTRSTALSLVHARAQLTPIYLLVAQGYHAQAAGALEALWASPHQAVTRFVHIDVRVLQALTAPSVPAATVCLQEALAMAEPEGYVRTFIDKGPGLADLLRIVRRQVGSSTYVNTLLAAFEADSRRATEPPDDPTAVHRDTNVLLEPLTSRELEILRLLADGLSNDQIADRLFITVGTVKTHLHRIYGKLDAENRTQAVARARTLHLL
jgi:LuxR family maltose regulon positive regulatory protein